MSALLYLLTAVLCLALARRVAPMSRGAAAVLVTLPLLFTGPALLTGRVYAPIDLAYTTEPLASMSHAAGVTHVANAQASDVYAQFVPWNAALRWAVAHHEWPLWNPFELAGNVLAAAAQSASYHPLTVIALLLPQSQALTFAASMLFFIAALTMFLLARELELAELAALFGAAAWAFSMHLVSFAHTAHANSLAMMPLVLLAARRIVREPRARNAALLMIALTLLMLCGHPESMLHVVFLASVFGLMEMWRAGDGKRRAGDGGPELERAPSPALRSPLPARPQTNAVFLASAFRPLETGRAGDDAPETPSSSPARRSPLFPARPSSAVAYALAAGLTTLLLTAVFVLPLFDALGQTREYLHRTSADGSGWHAASLREAVRTLPKQFVPFVEGMSGEDAIETASARHGWSGSGYAGALAFAPALYALWRARRRTTWFFAAVLVFGWLMGAQTPGLADLVQHLPLFSIAVNARMISFAALATSVLAAIGLDAWLKRPSRNELSFLLGGAAATTAIAIAALLPSMLESGLSRSFIAVEGMREVLPLLLAFAFCRVLPSARSVAVALLALLLLQRSGEAGVMQPSLDARAFYPPIAGLSTLPHDETQPYRIVGLGSILTANVAAHYGLEDVRGYQAMTFARLAATYPLWCHPQPVWSNRVDDLTAPMLSLMNVRYALAAAQSTIPNGWRHVGSFPGFELLENNRMLPRAFLPASVHEGVPTDDVLRAMTRARDFAAEAWIEGGTPGTYANGRGRISLRRQGSRLRMQIDMDAPGWVIVSEPAWRGWQAFDRDQPLDLRFADGAFVAFHLGAGSHDVRVFYRPTSFVAGGAISVATALLLLATWGILRRRSIPGDEQPAPLPA